MKKARVDGRKVVRGQFSKSKSFYVSADVDCYSTPTMTKFSFGTRHSPRLVRGKR